VRAHRRCPRDQDPRRNAVDALRIVHERVPPAAQSRTALPQAQHISLDGIVCQPVCRCRTGKRCEPICGRPAQASLNIRRLPTESLGGVLRTVAAGPPRAHICCPGTDKMMHGQVWPVLSIRQHGKTYAGQAGLL